MRLSVNSDSSLLLTGKQPSRPSLCPERVQISLHCFHTFHFRDESIQVGGRSTVSVGSKQLNG